MAVIWLLLQKYPYFADVFMALFFSACIHSVLLLIDMNSNRAEFSLNSSKTLKKFDLQNNLWYNDIVDALDG